MESVLGLSLTSTSVGWVLLDGQGPEAEILDNDAFDIQAANGAEGDKSPHAAAARGAQSIATASGHKVDSVQVTWTEEVEAGGTALLKSLADLGFDNVHSVSLSKAAQAWGIEVGRESEHAKTGLCILEPDIATLMIIATGAGTVRTVVTDTRESTEDLIEWLRTVFRTDGWLPESLYLVGAKADLDEVTQPVAEALPIAVSDSVDTQLALARGAALTTVSQGETGSPQAAEPPPEPPWRVSLVNKQADPATVETVVAATASDSAATTQVIEKPRTEQVYQKPRTEPKAGSSTRPRLWLVTHAKKLTIGAAAVAVFGAALSLAAGSALNVENSSAQAADPAAEGVPLTSVITRVPPQPVPRLQPVAAPPPPPPLEPPPPPAEPVAVAPEPAAVPVPQPTVTAVPHAVPAQEPVTPPTVAPLAAPMAPPPAAAPASVPPPAAAAAPVAPPPAAPPPPAPAEPAEPPSPDPLQQALSPLFGALP